MILFWFLIAAMISISLLFILLPLCLRTKASTVEQDKVNLALYRQKLQDLKIEYQDGLLTEQDYQQTQQELAQGLMLDCPEILHNETNAKSSSRHSTVIHYSLMVFLLLAIPALALSLYLKWGASQALAQQAAIQKTMAEFKSPDQLIEKMQAILKKRPNSTRGWFLLGRLYFSLGKFQDAANAFAKAHALEPKDTAITLQYAQALFFSGNGAAKTQAVQLAKQVLTVEAKSEAAINLLALTAYQQGHYQAAIDYWQQLLVNYAPDSNEANTLREAITKAQKQLKAH